MALDKSAARERILNFDFSGLFTQELGWDWHNAATRVTVAGREFTLQAVAEKRGFVVWHCPAPAGESLPDSALRRRIEHEATKAAHEHLVIFTDAARTSQVWQWVRRETGKPLRVRETHWNKGQSGEILIQKLERLFVSFEEEERMGLTDVVTRVGANVDERVTKRFYEEFRKQHGAFLKFITGIPHQGDHEWYASVMLNRLMFLYFVQRKGFLAGDPDYLRHRLEKLRDEHGSDQFYSFYRYFLLRLFHEGLGAKEHQAELEKLIGRVPYLNGGIFDVHKLERSKTDGGYGDEIQIPDTAFEAIFDFFDRFQWHLDERPLRDDNEINPDVLGYIFEKYINQKQMGAYYTKEDITGYIGQNTVLPFLFDAVRGKVRAAFEGEKSVWSHLQSDPDRYIYPAVRHGLSWDYQPGHLELGEPLIAERPLPAEIAAGLDTAQPDLLRRRKPWNKPAPAAYGLPTEIWRETVARRQRCADVRAKLAEGEVQSAADFITLNLDLRRFAQDVIARCDSAELLAAFWHTLAGKTPDAKSTKKPQPALTILDPTCGSGAFLFAALNLLEPLYEACLDRMEGLLADARAAGTRIHPESHLAEFADILQQVERHPNERYFIFKTIILRNLYGVDLMEEAVEICKLRLFLKLAAQVEPDPDDANLGIEPLPDIDFNIRAGNTLVGYATRAEVEAVAEKDLLLKEEVKTVLEAAENAAAAFDVFVQSQVDGENPAKFKRALSERLEIARKQCDRFLAESYRMGMTAKPKDFAAWKRSHQPFHWFVEFFSILKSGGFDIIIGNPPYVEVSDIASQYAIKQSSLLETGNLYALCMERFTHLLHEGAWNGVIVPISSVSTPRMLPLMRFMRSTFPLLYVSNFAVRPGKLFVGVDMNLTIFLGRKGTDPLAAETFSTNYNRWNEQARQSLFPTISYATTELSDSESAIPKTGADYSVRILKKIRRNLSFVRCRSESVGAARVFYHSGGRYFRKCIRQKLSNEYKPLTLKKGFEDAVVCLLSSSLYYWFWITISDCYHVTKRDIDALPVPESMYAGTEFASLATRLLEDLWTHAERRIRNRKDGSQREEVNFHVGRSQRIIDEIDAYLAKFYELTEDELDFVMNYDTKFDFRAKKEMKNEQLAASQ